MSDQDTPRQDESKTPGKQQLTLDPARRTLTSPHKPHAQIATGSRSVNVQVEVKKNRSVGPNKSRLSSDGASGRFHSKTLTNDEMTHRIQAVRQADALAKLVKPERPAFKHLPFKPLEKPVAGTATPPAVRKPESSAAPGAPESQEAQDQRAKWRKEDFNKIREKGNDQSEAKKPKVPFEAEKRPNAKRIQVSKYSGQQDLEAIESAASERYRKFKKKKSKIEQDDQPFVMRQVTIPESISVAELANRMAIRVADVIKALMKQGIFMTATQVIDGDIAQIICEELGHQAVRVADSDVEQLLGLTPDLSEDLVLRAPVVTIMGHVDHGKTSLLDAIRKTDVVAGEAGGITQHIGAYQIHTKDGQPITFIDTPGHAAFSEMRARGAKITDIVVLVVAADDGIKEQTVEAIHHAKAADVPIIVAVNKIDKPNADPQRVRNELLQHELVPESLGGDIIVVDVSAKTGVGLDALEAAILVRAEVLELKANPNKPARGVIIEASLEKGTGPVATVLVQEGTLKVGDILLAGTEYGRIKVMTDDRGTRLESAGLAFPVRVIGLSGAPLAGEKVAVVDEESKAVQIAKYRQQKMKDDEHKLRSPKSLQDLLQSKGDGEQKMLAVIVKGDVQGSVEAIKGSLEQLTDDRVKIRVLHTGVGAITEGDITLAKASKAVILAFNVRANPQARDMAKRDGITIAYHSIIYNLIDEIKKAKLGLHDPIKRDKFIGYAEVRQVFNVSKIGTIAGCMVTEGQVQRGAKVRLLRDNVVIHEGKLKSLKRFKEEAKEVMKGYECGMSFENYNDLKVGDVIECSVEETILAD